MKTTRSFVATASAIAALLGAGSAFAQQTIDHNKALAGNVTPGDTPGYPITLSQPGHYKLMSNLVVPAETGGIVITASNVTLDLNGFTISGPVTCSQNKSTRMVICSQPSAGSDQTKVGIWVQAGIAGTTLRNGTVRGFRGTGLWLREGESLQNLRVTENAHDGVLGATLDSDAGIEIVDSMIDLNGANGITAYAGLVARTRVASNGADGISWSARLIVQDSLVHKNYGIGLKNVSARGTGSFGNGTNRSSVTSLGGNVENNGVY